MRNDYPELQGLIQSGLPTVSRRTFLASASISAAMGVAASRSQATVNPSPKSRALIFICMSGGPSAVDTFDYKPALRKYHGKTVCCTDEAHGYFGQPGAIMESPFGFRQHGESGLFISALFPHLSAHADRLCVIRGVAGSSISHGPALLELLTGNCHPGSPTIAEKFASGLPGRSGFPASAILFDRGGIPTCGEFLTGMNSQFSPVTVRMTNKGEKCRNEREQLLAEATHSSASTSADEKIYGLGNHTSAAFGERCLAACRLIEQGCRSVVLISGAGYRADWDSHTRLAEQHKRMAASFDKPVAGLLTDLQQRGLLETTTVVCAGEFGRLPMAQNGSGRDHNRHNRLLWMAGAGIQGGTVNGETDELGIRSAKSDYNIASLHTELLSPLRRSVGFV